VGPGSVPPTHPHRWCWSTDGRTLNDLLSKLYSTSHRGLSAYACRSSQPSLRPRMYGNYTTCAGDAVARKASVLRLLLTAGTASTSCHHLSSVSSSHPSFTVFPPRLWHPIRPASDHACVDGGGRRPVRQPSAGRPTPYPFVSRRCVQDKSQISSNVAASWDPTQARMEFKVLGRTSKEPA